MAMDLSLHISKKTDGPFDKIMDKEDETIFHEREGWEEEVTDEG